MEMTPREIASEYRQAINKQKQIKVLAELNLCSQRRIAEILREQGEELPKHWVEKLSQPLKRAPRAEPASSKEIGEPPLGSPEPQHTLTNALYLERMSEAPALSLDEIRQAALLLIAERGPQEPERFQGYVRGIAALIAELEERSRAK